MLPEQALHLSTCIFRFLTSTPFGYQSLLGLFPRTPVLVSIRNVLTRLRIEKPEPLGIGVKLKAQHLAHPDESSVNLPHLDRLVLTID